MTDTTISSGVTSSGLTINGADTLTVDAGGTSRRAKVTNGGQIFVFGSSVSGIVSEATEIVESGGSTLGDMIKVGATATVDAGGAIVSAFVAPGGTLIDFGLASRAINGGTLSVRSGGVLLDSNNDFLLTIQRGGVASHLHNAKLLNVAAGGISNDDIDFGKEHIAGTTNRTTATSGGQVTVSAGGLAAGMVVSVAGTATIDAGGHARGLVVHGGKALVESGGVLNSATVSVGSLTTQSGATVEGVFKLLGGTTIISGAVQAGATFTMGAVTLELGDAADFAGAISGIVTKGAHLDLLGFASGVGETLAWSQGTGSGTLTITDGGLVATLDILGTHATSAFQMADDGNGGTLVTASQTAKFVQALAVVGGGSAVAHTPTAPVESPRSFVLATSA